MLDIFEGLRMLSLSTVALRMLLAVVCGGIIGIERTMSRHTAGFRTHILVCLGASLTTLTSQYMYLYMGYFTDISRLGAQVIAGIGFLGAGTIVTSKQRVRGLTTAAGLWTSAIIGLAIGAGFYEGAILTTILVEVAVTIFLRLENYVVAKTSNVHVFLEYTNPDVVEKVIDYCHRKNIDIMNLEITRPKAPENMIVALLSLRLTKGLVAENVLSALRTIDDVVVAERF
ncbi:MAG: MgtC/SapB family protein [Peptococcaceae bacterium]|nr:MgtC/SapB family protein [Peptococcaceae bacterium]